MDLFYTTSRTADKSNRRNFSKRTNVATVRPNLFAGGVDEAESPADVHAAVGLHTETLLVNRDAGTGAGVASAAAAGAAAVASPPRQMQLDAGERCLGRSLLETGGGGGGGRVGHVLLVVLHLCSCRLLRLQFANGITTSRVLLLLFSRLCDVILTSACGFEYVAINICTYVGEADVLSSQFLSYSTGMPTWELLTSGEEGSE